MTSVTRGTRARRVSRVTRRPALWLGGGYLAVLALIAFWPSPVDAPFRALLDRVLARAASAGFPGLTYDVIESTGNVLLFVPFGLVAGLLLRARLSWIGVVLGVMVSGAIEVGQGLFLRDRVSTVHDVLTNGLGALLGVLLGTAVRGLVAARERRRRREEDHALATIPLRGASSDPEEADQRPRPR